MIKNGLLAILCMAFASTLSAQDEKLVSLGIKAGVNYHTVAGKTAQGNKIDNDYKLGFTAGLYADMFIAEGFYLQPGLMYSTKGAQKKIDDNKSTLTVSYVELPVNLVLKPKLGSGNFIVSAGPYVAYGINGNFEATNNGNTKKVDATFKSNISAAEYANYITGNEPVYYLRRFDAGANAAIGYELKSGFGLQVYAQYSFLKLNPEVEATVTDRTKWRNQGAGATLSYRF